MRQTVVLWGTYSGTDIPFHYPAIRFTSILQYFLPHSPIYIAHMADPFEVRIRFTSQLQHLNASVNSSQKAAHYALKYRDMDEDLHSCIIERLEDPSTSMSVLLAMPLLLSLT